MEFEIGKLYKSERVIYKLASKFWGKRVKVNYLVFENIKTGCERLIREDLVNYHKFTLSLEPYELL